MLRAKTEIAAGSKTLALVLLLAALMALSLMLTATPAHAATTFTINDTGDFFDHNVGDGVCDFTISEGDRCSLRAAIQRPTTPITPAPIPSGSTSPGAA